LQGPRTPHVLREFVPPRRMVLVASYGGGHGNGRRSIGSGDVVAVPQQQPLRVPPLQMADTGQVPSRSRSDWLGKPHGDVHRHIEPNQEFVPKGSVSFCGKYSRCPGGSARGNQVPKRQSAPSLPGRHRLKVNSNSCDDKAPSARARTEAAFAQSMANAWITPHAPPPQDNIATPRMIVSHMPPGRRSRPHKPLVHDYSHHGKKCKTYCGIGVCLPGGQEMQRRCCRCKDPAESYFDHVCPNCRATVCLSCLDDLRLLLNHFRCPRCGDETANQEKLRSEIWILNAYRSTNRLWNAISKTFLDIFDEDCGPPQEPCATRTVTQPVYMGHPGRPRYRNAFSAPAPPAVPEHGTRPPLDWNHAAARFANYSGLRPGDIPGPTNTTATRVNEEQIPDLKTRLPVGWEDEGWYGNAAKRSGTCTQNWGPEGQAWNGASVEIPLPDGGSDDGLSDGEPLPPPPPPLPEPSPYETRPW